MTKSAQQARLQGARWIMRWLATFPGENWQQRWQACPASADARDWTSHIRRFGQEIGARPTHSAMTAGLLALICADAVRPDLSWLASRNSRFLRLGVEATRDVEGFARLRTDVPTDVLESQDGSRALIVLAHLVVAYGGGIE
ncbi:site-specific integrase, partial [Embleya sp. NPDC005971]